MADDVVKAAMRVNLCLHGDAVLDVLELLVQGRDLLLHEVHGARLLLLFVRGRVMRVEVVAFDG